MVRGDRSKRVEKELIDEFEFLQPAVYNYVTGLKFALLDKIYAGLWNVRRFELVVSLIASADFDALVIA